MPDGYKVKVSIGDAIVEVEGDREGIAGIVADLLNALPNREQLALPAGAPKIEQPSSMTDSPPDASERSVEATDPKSLFARKKPSTLVESAVTAGYYLTYLAPEAERTAVFGSDTIVEVFRKAGRKLPKSAVQMMVDTHKGGYFDRTEVRGEYRLNNVGENLVNHTLGSET